MSDNINSVNIEVHAGTDLKIFTDDANKKTHGNVFALHNPFVPEGKDKAKYESLPLTIGFPKHLLPYAEKVIKTGSHFIVTGELRMRTGQDSKQYWNIQASALTPIFVPGSDTDEPAPGDEPQHETTKSKKSTKPKA